jgi:hypothetical protein
MLAGGLGGTAFWLACYPLDVVKSKIQIDSYTKPQFKGMVDCAKKVRGLISFFSCFIFYLSLFLYRNGKRYV